MEFTHYCVVPWFSLERLVLYCIVLLISSVILYGIVPLNVNPLQVLYCILPLLFAGMGPSLCLLVHYINIIVRCLIVRVNDLNYYFRSYLPNIIQFHWKITRRWRWRLDFGLILKMRPNLVFLLAVLIWI